MSKHNDLVVPQNFETPVKVGRHASFAWRYAYQRSADTRKANDTGQDFLAFGYNDQTFVFALCDGVGQSFFGEVAARYLGKVLLDWLWKDSGRVMDATEARDTLARRLTSVTGEASRLVKNQTLPGGIPRMLREVLEQKREIGSESTFSCGRIDAPGELFPDGRLLLAWMGDSRIRMWDPGDERTDELGDTFRTEQRWSTKLGPVKGKPNIHIGPLTSDDRRVTSQIAVYSDGFSLLDSYPRTPATDELETLMNMAFQSPTSDDISFLEIGVDRVVSAARAAEQEAPGREPVSSAATLAAATLPPPAVLSSRVTGDKVNAAWEALPGATYYQVELDNGKPALTDVRTTVWASPPLEPGNYRMRVRAVGDEPGEWSTPEQLVVASIAAPAPPLEVPLAPAPAAMPVAASRAIPAGAAAAPVAATARAAGAPDTSLPIVPIVAGVVVLLAIAVVAFLFLGSKGGGGNPSGSAPTAAAAVSSGAVAPITPGSAAEGPLPLLKTIFSGGGPFTQVAFAPGSTLILAAGVSSAERNLQIFSGASGSAVVSRTVAEQIPVTALAFSADGKMMAVGLGDGSVSLFGAPWQAGPQGVSAAGIIPAAAGEVKGVAFSPDGRYLAIAQGTTARLWDLQSGLAAATIPAAQPLTGIAFQPDGQAWAASSEDGQLYVVAAPPNAKATPQALGKGANALAYAPDGKTLAVAFGDNQAGLWSNEGRNLISMLSGHTGPINSLAWSPDGQVLATASDDKTVRLWQAQGGKLLGALKGHEGAVTDVAFSPDGRVLASGSGDSTVRLWGADSGAKGVISEVLLASSGVGGQGQGAEPTATSAPQGAGAAGTPSAAPAGSPAVKPTEPPP